MLNSDMFADTVEVPVTLPHLYKDDKGEPITLRVSLRIETGADVEEQQKQSLGNGSADHRTLFRFCQLLAKAPEQLEDFPSDETMSLQDRARLYCNTPGKLHFAYCALRVYDKVTVPTELFR